MWCVVCTQQRKYCTIRSWRKALYVHEWVPNFTVVWLIENRTCRLSFLSTNSIDRNLHKLVPLHFQPGTKMHNNKIALT